MDSATPRNPCFRPAIQQGFFCFLNSVSQLSQVLHSSRFRGGAKRGEGGRGRAPPISLDQTEGSWKMFFESTPFHRKIWKAGHPSKVKVWIRQNGQSGGYHGTLQYLSETFFSLLLTVIASWVSWTWLFSPGGSRYFYRLHGPPSPHNRRSHLGKKVYFISVSMYIARKY